MNRPRKAAAFLLVSALVACGGRDSANEAAPERSLEASEASSAQVEPPLYDAEGRLLPSDVRVAGLTLPRGLETVGEDRSEHVYVTDVPTRKVLAYFGPRLFTVQIDQIGSGGVYRRARPVEARGGVVHLDVSVLAASEGRTLVTVHELPVAAAELPTDPASRLAREQAYRSLD